MSRQQLLEMRLTTLEEYVAKVRQILSEADRRGSVLTDLEERLASTAAMFDDLSQARQVTSTLERILADEEFTVRAALEDIQQSVIEKDNFTAVSLPDQLELVPHRLESVELDLIKARNTLTRARNIAVRLDSSHSRQLEDGLSTRCSKITRKVEKLRADLSKLPDEADCRSVWVQYETLVSGQCDELFADYVDFLGGLTLRDTALDGQVCTIADGLLAEILLDQKRLALPSRRGTLRSALDYLVRLRFPEWTIWELPFVAHELGLSYNAHEQPLNDLVNAGIVGHEPQFVCELFADAFATYTMGPAYACAATLLRFQPQHDDHNPKTSSDVERAVVIFELLACMDPTGHSEFSAVVYTIEKRWQQAMANVVQPYDPEVLREFTRRAHGALTDSARLQRFEPRDWKIAMESLKAALSGERDGQPWPNVPWTVRDLINVAWGARLDKPKLTHEITKNVVDLFQHKQRGHASPSRNEPPR
ncbi:hypothetical protein [Streptomyces sp. NPDC000618]|uniref:hypothetical protein n=1 Tax=Streptomyces sp. NPDC000618 TaxID=3154265 RepID=UPI003318592E